MSKYDKKIYKKYGIKIATEIKPEEHIDWYGSETSEYNDGSNLEEATNRMFNCRSCLELIRYLSPRERKIIRMRFGIGGGGQHTLKEVGCRFGTTTERMRQIEAKILQKLKDHPVSQKITP